MIVGNSWSLGDSKSRLKAPWQCSNPSSSALGSVQVCCRQERLTLLIWHTAAL